MAKKDVTEHMRFGNPDDEILPLEQCVCGAKFKFWDTCLSIYEDDPHVMECCGRKLFFQQSIRIFEVQS